MSTLELFLLLVGAHFLADYPLQGDFLAKAKNHEEPIFGVPWYQALFAHSYIHAVLVWWLTGSLVLGVLELVAHFIIDYLKSWAKYAVLRDGANYTENRAVTDYNIDQALHVACKLLWALVAF